MWKALTLALFLSCSTAQTASPQFLAETNGQPEQPENKEGEKKKEEKKIYDNVTDFDADKLGAPGDRFRLSHEALGQQM